LKEIGGPSQGNQQRPLSYVRCRTTSVNLKFTTSGLNELFCTHKDGVATAIPVEKSTLFGRQLSNVESVVPQSADLSIIAKRGRRLEYFTIGWNSFEGLAALTTGIISGSISLVGFGVDSFIEVTSAIALL
jgi:hypothetical protein